MTALAPHVRILGLGTGRARHLTEAEAEGALALVLDGKAAPEAVGALLMLMRCGAVSGNGPSPRGGKARLCGR